MSPLLVDVNALLQGSEATFIPDEGIPIIYPQVANAAAQLQAMRVVCYQLLQILDTPYNVSSSARYSAISEIHPELKLVRAACSELLQILESPCNLSNAAPLEGHEAPREPTFSGTHLQVILTATQLKFVWVTCHQLLQVYGSLHDESNATQSGEHQVFRDSAISQVATQLKLALVAGYQLLQVYGILPNEYIATLLGERHELDDTASQIQTLPPAITQTTNIQEAGVPVNEDALGRLHCLYGDCKATFGRPQERKRYIVDVHTLRRQCPFCLYEWSRPGKIRAHMMKNHHDELPPEVLNEIRVKRGQHLVAFLDNVIP